MIAREKSLLALGDGYGYSVGYFIRDHTMQQSIRDMIMKHYGPLMTGLVILFLILMTAAAREFINYTMIQENIDHQIAQQEYWSEKIAFEQNFLIPYLDSSSALFFYQHENSILGEDEYVIHLQAPENDTNPVIEISAVQATQDARKSFFYRVIGYVREH